jgi:hypothetical protein
VTVIFQGPVYGGKAGLDELIDNISQAVDQRGNTLVASQVKDLSLAREVNG